MKNIVSRIVLSIFLLLSSPLSFAHFHYQIAVNTTFEADNNANLKALSFVFLYDPNVSQIYLEDNDNLKEFAVGLVKDLAPLHHFSEVLLNGKPLKTLPATNASAERIGTGENTRLKVRFTLPLARPVKLKGVSRFQIKHVDSTASATLYYETPGNIHFAKSLRPDCIADIQEIKGFEQGEQPQKVSVVCDIK